VNGMSTYFAITRIRINGALFLPGEHVYGLSEAGAAALVKAGRLGVIPSEPEATPKTAVTPKTKTGKKDA